MPTPLSDFSQLMLRFCTPVMRSAPTCVMTAAAIATMLSVGAGADASALTVRLYDAAGLSARDLTPASRTAESILREPGLNVTIRHCGRKPSPDAPIDACDTPLKPDEVVVRVIEAPAIGPALHVDAYGVAYVVPETDRGWLATVFADRVERAAARAGVECGTILGRVIAHEVGHLLLGRRYHAEVGLMRAEWPDPLLRRDDDEWRFSPVESARIHRLLRVSPRAFLVTPSSVGPATD